jgi:dihydrofolate reductase
MQLTIVVAASANNVIGRQGKLPWRLPEDLRRFRQLTTGKPVLMGRRTFASIGRPLPGRRNIVISRQPGLGIAGCEVAATPEDALALLDRDAEAMIIGGGEIYRALLPRTDRIEMTRVHLTIDGDAFFPELKPEEWRLVAAEEYPSSESRPGFTFETLDRRPVGARLTGDHRFGN